MKLVLAAVMSAMLCCQASPALTVLDNGLRIITVENHSSKTVAVQIWVKTGSGYETDNDGVSHFLEHMMFKGTKKRGVGDIDKELDFIGASNNAGTAKEYTYYHVNGFSKFTEKMLEIECDAVLNSILDSKELKKEGEVVCEEIRMCADEPGDVVWDTLSRLLYGSHPYSKPILGTEKFVKNCTSEDMMKYYKSHYVPNNMVVVASGDFKTEEFISLVKKYMGHLKTASISYVPALKAEPLDKNTHKTVVMDVQMSTTAIGFLAPEADDEDCYAIDVIMAYLGQGKSAHLKKLFVDDLKIAAQVDCGNYTRRPPSMIYFTAELEPGKENIFEEYLCRELDQIAANGIKAADLKRAKTLIESSTVYSNETNEQKAENLGWYEIVADYTWYEKYLSGISGVSQNRIKQAAQKWLLAHHATATVIPEGGAE